MKYVQLACRLGIIAILVLTGVLLMVKKSLVNMDYIASALIVSVVFAIGYIYLPSFEDDNDNKGGF